MGKCRFYPTFFSSALPLFPETGTLIKAKKQGTGTLKSIHPILFLQVPGYGDVETNGINTENFIPIYQVSTLMRVKAPLNPDVGRVALFDSTMRALVGVR